MGRTFVETIMGAVVLAVAGIFLAFALSQSDVGMVKGYTLSASFASVGGLSTGSDVRINGIKVGTVSGQSIDQNTYNAVVKLSVTPTIHLPKDTVASIASDGMLGSKFLKLEPGRAEEKIAEGGTIETTKNFESLEEEVGKVIFLATDNGNGNKNGGGDKSGDKK